MRRKNTMRGASPLGGMLVAISITLIAAYGMVGWIGSYQAANAEPLNPFLASSINALGANFSAPTGPIFGSTGSSNSVANQIFQSANNTKGTIGSITAAASDRRPGVVVPGGNNKLLQSVLAWELCECIHSWTAPADWCSFGLCVVHSLLAGDGDAGIACPQCPLNFQFAVIL